MKKHSFIPQGSLLDCFLSKKFNSTMFTYREIFSMLLPILLDNFFLFICSVCSTALISSSSQESVSAVALMQPVQVTVVTLVNAFAAGGTVIVAQYKGKMDEDKTRIAGGQVILGTMAISIVACILLSAFAFPVVNTLFRSVDEVVKIKGRDYLVGMSISMVPFAAYMSIFSVFRGIGYTKICLRLTVIINTIFMAASIFFINFLKLDIVGTALAMNVARVIGGSIAVYYIMGPKSPLRIRLSDIVKPRRAVLLSTLNVAIPYGVEQIFFNGGSVLVQVYMAGLGTMSVAAYAVSNSAVSLFYVAATSVGTLAITVCGRCIGARDKKRTRNYGVQMVHLSVVLSLISVVIFYPILPLLLKVYHTPLETLMLIKRLLLITVVPVPVFYSMATVMPNILRSAGDSMFSSMVSLITMWTIRVALGYYLGIVLGYGVLGIAACMGIECVVKTLVFGFRFRGDAWLNKKTIEE